MSLNEAVRYVRASLKADGRLTTIRGVRRQTGLTFRSARAMVDEIRAGANWYRNIK